MQAMEDAYERLKKLNMMREILKSIVCEDKNRPKNLDKEDQSTLSSPEKADKQSCFL